MSLEDVTKRAEYPAPPDFHRLIKRLRAESAELASQLEAWEVFADRLGAREGGWEDKNGDPVAPPPLNGRAAWMLRCRDEETVFRAARAFATAAVDVDDHEEMRAFVSRVLGRWEGGRG